MNTASSNKMNYYMCFYCFCGSNLVHQPNHAKIQHNMQTNWQNHILCYEAHELPEYLTWRIPRVCFCPPILRTHLQKLVCDFMKQSGRNSSIHISVLIAVSSHLLLSFSGLLGFTALLSKVCYNQY